MTIVLFILFMITNDVSFFILLMIFLSLSISMCIYDLVSWVGEPIRNRSQVYWFSDGDTLTSIYIMIFYLYVSLILSC